MQWRLVKTEPDAPMQAVGRRLQRGGRQELSHGAARRPRRLGPLQFHLALQLRPLLLLRGDGDVLHLAPRHLALRRPR